MGSANILETPSIFAGRPWKVTRGGILRPSRFRHFPMTGQGICARDLKRIWRNLYLSRAAPWRLRSSAPHSRLVSALFIARTLLESRTGSRKFFIYQTGFFSGMAAVFSDRLARATFEAREPTAELA